LQLSGAYTVLQNKQAGEETEGKEVNGWVNTVGQSETQRATKGGGRRWSTVASPPSAAWILWGWTASRARMRIDRAEQRARRCGGLNTRCTIFRMAHRVFCLCACIANWQMADVASDTAGGFIGRQSITERRKIDRLHQRSRSLGGKRGELGPT